VTEGPRPVGSPDRNCRKTGHSRGLNLAMTAGYQRNSWSGQPLRGPPHTRNTRIEQSTCAPRPAKIFQESASPSKGAPMSVLDREAIIAPTTFNRWLIPPAALAIHLSIGQAYAFSVFKLPLAEHFGMGEGG